jgi:hypothetical protein
MAGGPDPAQLAALLEPLATSPQLIGMSVADFRPDLDQSGRHPAQIVGLLRGLLDRGAWPLSVNRPAPLFIDPPGRPAAGRPPTRR